jgi:replicative DNA helicase
VEITRRKIDDRVEEKILTGLIVSTAFCRNIISILPISTFTSPHIRRVASWCFEYYKRYESAPFKEIQDFVDNERKNLDKEEKELIEIFLDRIAEEYDDGQSINSEYLKDITIEYIRKRNLTEKAARIDALLENNNLDEAEKEIETYNRVYVETSGWENPFAPESIREYFKIKRNKEDDLFRFPGAIGNMVGTFQRNWLAAYLAPVKRGKTFWLIETAVRATIERKKVAIFSLEMNKQRIRDRVYKRIISANDESKEFIFPCFDCLKNQDGSCNKVSRTNDVALYNEEGKKPKFSKDMKYSNCVECRGTRDYIPGYWFSSIKRNKMRLRETEKALTTFDQTFGRSLQIKSYPANSANLQRIKSDLDVLENAHDFIPDVIVIDYADILAPEDSRITGRERLDETWKALKNLSDSRHCLVVTASQANRASFKKKFVTQTDIAEDIRKLAHVDIMMSLNQTRFEKKASIMRVNLIAERDGAFDEYASCLVLQQLSLGQVMIDSELAPVEKDEEDDDD